MSRACDVQMRKILGLILALWGTPCFAAAPPASPSSWPQWRGPHHNGTTDHANPVVEWSEMKNVKWKVPLPGNGSSTPIVWGQRLFVTTAVPVSKGDSHPSQEENTRRRGGRSFRSETPTDPYQFQLLCYDRETGRLLWSRTAVETIPHEGHHQDHGFASHSPVTDGERVYAYFGSRGLHCYDLEGKLLWSKSFGKMETRNAFGEGSSPLLVKDTVIINWDHEKEDFVVALDKITGEERWRQTRDEPTSWATPIAVEHEGKTQVVINATNRIRSYDLATGELIWECGGMTSNVIPTPIASEGLVYAMSGFRGNALLAIKLGHKGDLTDSDAIAWSYDSKTPYVPSPLLYQGRLYFFSQNTGILSCLRARTGEVLIDAERLPGLSGVYASPVAAAGRIYVIGRNGEGLVLKASDTLEILASNRLDDRFDASPVLVDSEMFLRGHRYLYCLAEK